MSSGSVVAKQPGGGAGGGVVGSVGVAPTDSIDVDVVSLTLGKGCKWMLYIDDGASLAQTSELMVHEEATVVKTTQYAVLGDKIDYVIAVSSDGADLKLNITNNETNSITVKFRRLTV